VSDLADRLASARELRGLRAEHDRVRLTARLEDLERRWADADGLGPLPGGHAAWQALDSADLPRVRLALNVSLQALGEREDAFVSAPVEAPPSVPPGEIPASLRVLLDELRGTGRPVRALTEQEQAEPDPSRIRGRIRTDAIRLRLLFDLDHLAPHLPAGLPETLARDADLATTPQALFAIRERLITVLTGRPPDPHPRYTR
jgi:hypothetical protein